jgi:hypothetical protein
MSKGREPIRIAVWIERLLSAFSRLDPDSARAARDGCDRAGERELSWYGKRKEHLIKMPTEPIIIVVSGLWIC